MEQTLVGWMFEHPWMTFFTVLAGIAAGEHIAVAIIVTGKQIGRAHV